MPVKPETFVSVIPEEAKKHDCQIKKIAVDVLQNKWKSGFAAVFAMPRFANRAGRRIKEKGAVVGLAVVVTGHAETQRAGQDQQRGRKRPHPMGSIDQWRIER